jgi:hypothetical protein
MPAAKRRPKREDEILDLEYLANNSTLEGMLSHLKPELRTAYTETFPAPIPSAAAAEGSEIAPVPSAAPTDPDTQAPAVTGGPAIIDAAVSEAVPLVILTVREAPGSTGPVSATVFNSPPDAEPLVLEPPETDAQVLRAASTAADATPPVVNTAATAAVTITGPPVRLPRGVSLFRWRQAPECHNRGEEQVRSKLWQAANDAGDETLDRFIEIPQSYISHICGLGETQTRAALRGLADKMAITLEHDYHEDGRPRRYRLRSFKNMNHLRRQAGLLWVLRQGPGVRLLDEQSARTYLAANGGPAITGSVIDAFLTPSDPA